MLYVRAPDVEAEREELGMTPRGGFLTPERLGLPLVRQGDSGGR